MIPLSTVLINIKTFPNFNALTCGLSHTRTPQHRASAAFEQQLHRLAARMSHPQTARLIMPVDNDEYRTRMRVYDGLRNEYLPLSGDTTWDTQGAVYALAMKRAELVVVTVGTICMTVIISGIILACRVYCSRTGVHGGPGVRDCDVGDFGGYCVGTVVYTWSWSFEMVVR